ncbi:DNA N-glycosylase and apurinic/apyrimidinic (AP) lyase [Dinochytrium kinnereticum]|nr:DNA N-glycosylase and apurinic/apyrimidinic (AP) lyase [Dinochytrium kinnereticum]
MQLRSRTADVVGSEVGDGVGRGIKRQVVKVERVKEEGVGDIEDCLAGVEGGVVTPVKKRKGMKVETPDGKSGDGTPGGRKKKVKKEVMEPEGWKEIYELIKDFRSKNIAPVDEVGCGSLALKDSSPKTYRFQTLVALMLSSQTKDPITAAAVHRLQTQLPNGLTPQSVSTQSALDIQNIIHGVGFHVKKAVYLKKVADICLEKFGGDIPETVEGLMELPGVGPKMAYLAMQCGWGVSVGVGVDTHVHRISNRLGWVKSKEAEETREESWLPSTLWTEINPLLVGFGQTVCGGVSPSCGICPISYLCRKIGVKRSRSILQTPVKKVKVILDEMEAPVKLSWVGVEVKEEEEEVKEERGGKVKEEGGTDEEIGIGIVKVEE